LADKQQQFEAKDAQVLAIASQTAAEALNTVDKLQRPTLPFPILADVNHKVATAYGVFGMPTDPNAPDEPPNTLSAYPSVFILDSNLKIVWKYKGTSDSDRPQLPQIISNLP
jgi:peroxiredoxin